jgi:hypothetical protein
MVTKSYYLIFFTCIFLIYAKSLESRLYFIHIPKTGGTTLRLLLEQQLSMEEIYPFKNPKNSKTPIKQDLVSGHFPYYYCRKMDPEFEKAFKITILRDPVERYLSFLRAKKKADPSLPTLESVIQLRTRVNSKYKAGLIDNALCRNLAKDPGLEGEALLNSAKETLHEFDEIIFYDHYSEEIVDFFQRLDIDLKKEEIPRINTTTKEFVNNNILEEVKSLNQLDILLYEYAKNYYVKSKKKYKLRIKSYEELLKTKSEIHYTFDQPLNGRGWTYRDLSNGPNIQNPVFRWVTDLPAFIYFSLQPDMDYNLFFTAQQITPEVLPKVKVNGLEIFISELNQPSLSLYHGIIPKEIIQKQPTEIMFFATKTFEYRDIYPSNYNRNHPPLAFAMHQIQILKKQ